MARSSFYKMLLMESDSDKELEIIANLAMEEEISTSHGRPKKRCTFIRRDRVVQILILASARIVCNIVYVQVRDRIHRELCCEN
jgi:hypothetical protein